MSTRASIVYVAGLHIFEEVLSGEICVHCNLSGFGGVNDKYEDPTISIEELRQIRDSIDKYLRAK